MEQHHVESQEGICNQSTGFAWDIYLFDLLLEAHIFLFLRISYSDVHHGDSGVGVLNNY